MKDVAMLVSSFAGGLFLGYLTAIFAFFVWQLIKEALGNLKQMLIPALFLLCMFGTGLVYLALVVLQNWAVSLGAVITFAYGARSLFSSGEEVDEESKT